MEKTPVPFNRPRDVYSNNNLSIGWETVGVMGGRVYAIRIDDLI